MSSSKYNRRERKQAHKDKARPVSNSGRGFEKGDAQWNGFLLDYKFNENSFTLSLRNWLKHRSDAWNTDMMEPAVVVKFGDNKTEVVCVDWQYFKDLYAEIQTLQEELSWERHKDDNDDDS